MATITVVTTVFVVVLAWDERHCEGGRRREKAGSSPETGKIGGHRGDLNALGSSLHVHTSLLVLETGLHNFRGLLQAVIRPRLMNTADSQSKCNTPACRLL